MSGEVAAPAAPAAAPSAPSAPASAPSAPAADPRGKPPRGHAWKDAPTQTAPKAGQVPVPSQPRTAQSISTGEPPKPPQRAQQPAAPKVDPSAKPETQTQRAARLEKLRTADGQEVEVDVAELLERYNQSEKRKVKVNGQEREVSIAEAFERFPLADGAHQRYFEASQIEKRAAAMDAQLRKGLEPLRNPKQALGILERIHGPEQAQAMMEEYLAAKYEREKMPPQQRAELEARETAQREIQTERQKLAQEKAEWEATQEAQRKERFEAATKTEIARLHRDYPILLREAGLPVTPRTMARLAQAAGEARALKIPYTEKQLAAQVAKEYREDLGHFGEAAEPEALREMLGKGADKIRQAEVDRVMKQPGRGRAVQAKPAEMPKEIKTPDQWRKWRREQDLIEERRASGRR